MADRVVRSKKIRARFATKPATSWRFSAMTSEAAGQAGRSLDLPQRKYGMSSGVLQLKVKPPPL